MKILTFDIEDWFHILDHSATATSDQWEAFPSRLETGVGEILELLEESGHQATFFCLGWVAQKYPWVVRSISEAGHEIGTHSHLHKLVYQQTPQEFGEDLRKSKVILEDLIGRKVSCYRAPGFSITSASSWAFELLIENEIEYDCSIFPAPRAHGGIPDAGISGPAKIALQSGTLKCFPMNAVTLFGTSFVFSGGGYFRLLPRSYLRYLFAREPYVMTYFHPRDFDPDQPVLSGLSPLRRFKTYVGLRSSQQKLREILGLHSFMSISEAASEIDWSVAPNLNF